MITLVYLLLLLLIEQRLLLPIYRILRILLFTFRENDIPTEGVTSVVQPRAFQDIRALGVARTASDAVNAQPMFGGVAQAGGLGASFTQGMNKLGDTMEYMGVTIVKSNHVLTDNKTGGVDEIGGARYNLNFQNSQIKSVTWQKNAVAALKLQGLKVDTVDDIRRNTVFHRCFDDGWHGRSASRVCYLPLKRLDCWPCGYAY